MIATETRVVPNDPQFLRLETLLNFGDVNAALALWNEAMNKQFESGCAYMQENVGELHQEN